MTSVNLNGNQMLQRPKFSMLVSHLVEIFGEVLDIVHGTEARALNVFCSFLACLYYFFFVLDLLHCFLFPVLLSTACIPQVKCSFSTESYHHDVLPMYLGECGWNNIYYINSSIWTMEIELRAPCLPVKCSTIWDKTELSKRLNHL